MSATSTLKNWSQHGQSGVFVNYPDLDQIFPSTNLVPTVMDFPS
jgi:hypothetical protein